MKDMDETCLQQTSLAIGRRWLICPPDYREPAPPDSIPLIVPTGAFGSGEHETTASCLEVVENVESIETCTVLDVGCGTGILAIAALKLGADRATGIDIEVKAAATSRVAARLNGVHDRFQIVLGPLDAVVPGRFNLILANLYGDVLLDIAHLLVAAATARATIVFSGIAWEYAFQIRTRYEGLGCSVISERWLQEFVTMVLEAPHD